MANHLIPKADRIKAKALGLNLTGFCRRAVALEIARIENEAGANAAKLYTPTTNPVKEKVA